MRAFVTGARGFAGSWLVEHLRQAGDEVLAPEVDVTDAEALRREMAAARPDAVYHLAAVSVPRQAAADPGRAEAVNAGGTRNLLEATAELVPSARVLVTSTAGVYLASESPRAEDAPVGGDDVYVRSKLAAERSCSDALADGGDVVLVRPFNHTGPRQTTDLVVPALARRILEARRGGQDTVLTGPLDRRRDLTDARDVVRAYRLLVERAPAGTYNVCSGRAVALSDVARHLARLAGVPHLAFEVVPHLVRPGDPPVVEGDPSRIREATGWSPEIPLEKTLSDVLAWCEREAGSP